MKKFGYDLYLIVLIMKKRKESTMVTVNEQFHLIYISFRFTVLHFTFLLISERNKKVVYIVTTSGPHLLQARV